MVRGTRGRGRVSQGRGRADSRTGAGASGGSSEVIVIGTKCGLCKSVVGDDVIGCDTCSCWYHPSSLCCGLPDSVIKTIQEYGGRRINFCCTDCRLSAGSVDTSQRVGDGEVDGMVSKQAVKRPFKTVKNLCASVGELSSNMKKLTESVKKNSIISSGEDVYLFIYLFIILFIYLFTID